MDKIKKALNVLESGYGGNKIILSDMVGVIKREVSSYQDTVNNSLCNLRKINAQSCSKLTWDLVCNAIEAMEFHEYPQQRDELSNGN